MSQDNALTPAPDTSPSTLAALRPWQRRIVALVQSGVPIRDACAQQHVSWASLDDYTRDGGPFADAIQAAEAGVALLGAEETRQNAIAHAFALVEDSVRESRDGSIKPADRRNNRRDVYEVGGLISRGGPLVAIQVNHSSRVWDAWGGARDEKAPSGAPAVTGGEPKARGKAKVGDEKAPSKPAVVTPPEPPGK